MNEPTVSHRPDHQKSPSCPAFHGASAGSLYTISPPYPSASLCALSAYKHTRTFNHLKVYFHFMQEKDARFKKISKYPGCMYSLLTLHEKVTG